MAHSRVVVLMSSYADMALNNNNPRLFLENFASMHDWWHRVGRVPGFLLFHWYAIKNLKRCGADKVLGATIEPFTEEEWVNMEWPYQLESDVQEGDINSLAVFSNRLENWHNEAHMAVTIVTGQDLMNPLTNIFILDFWKLHYFIDMKFHEALRKFNAENISIEEIINKLEHEHHLQVNDV